MTEQARLNVVLFEPEIPQNTGNIARTCACTGARLHLVEPMGFRLTQRNLARAGLDYWDDVEIVRHPCVEAFLSEHDGIGTWFFTGHADRTYSDVDWTKAGCDGEVFLIFGRESRGIDPEILETRAQRCLRIPMLAGKRSLNLSNSVAIALYEALRQRSFSGLALAEQ